MKRLIPTLAMSGLLLAACGNDNSSDRRKVEGPVVSGPEAPRNSALGNDNASTLTSGANSFTEDQARAAMEEQGFTDIGPLTQDAQGIWSATATKGSASTKVSVDYKGSVASN